MPAPIADSPRHRSGLPPDWPGPAASAASTSAHQPQPGASQARPRSVVGFVPPAADDDHPEDHPDDQSDNPPRLSPPRSGRPPPSTFLGATGCVERIHPTGPRPARLRARTSGKERSPR